MNHEFIVFFSSSITECLECSQDAVVNILHKHSNTKVCQPGKTFTWSKFDAFCYIQYYSKIYRLSWIQICFSTTVRFWHFKIYLPQKRKRSQKIAFKDFFPVPLKGTDALTIKKQRFIDFLYIWLITELHISPLVYHHPHQTLSHHMR